ncbi:MAG: ExbD/TolR family protein [Alphaproteobacteria bacterium]|nr:ExbD/TolR family protein [Alphaproteobacteria bacterium]
MGASTPGRSRGGRRRTFNEINVTPFVDVMLVLLIIFMVTAPMLTAGVEVNLPESAASPLNGSDERLALSINGSNEIYLQETRIELDQIQAKLIAISGENREAQIVVRGDQGIDYGLVMQVAGEVSAAGFSKIALETTLKQGRR